MSNESTKVPLTEARVEHVQPIDAAFIACVERKGDSLDIVRDRLQHFRAHYALRAGMLTTGFATGLLGSWETLSPRHFAYGVAAAGMSETHQRIKNRRYGNKIEGLLNQNDAMAIAAGEPLELIRKSTRRKHNREVQLLWRAEFDGQDHPAEVRGRLQDVAALAKSSGLRSVIVPDEIINFANEARQQAYADQAVPISHWLKTDKKRMPIIAFSEATQIERAFIKLTPDECFELAECIEGSKEVTFNSFEYAWKILRQERPGHVMFRRFAAQFEKLADTSARNGIHDEARQTIARHLALALDDTTVQRGPNNDRVRVNLRGTIDSRNPAVRLQGSQAVDSMIGQESVHAEENGALLSHLNLQDNDFRLFFENPGKMSDKKRIQVSEVVLLFKLGGWELPYEPEDRIEITGSSQIDAETVFSPSLQQSVAVALGTTNKVMRERIAEPDRKNAENINFYYFAKNRLVRFTAAAALALTLSSEVGTRALATPANYLYERRKSTYIDDLRSRDMNELLEKINQDDTFDAPMRPEELEQIIKQAEETGVLPYDLYDDFDRELPVDPYNRVWLMAADFDNTVRDTLARIQGMPVISSATDLDNEVSADSAKASENADLMQEQDRASVGNVGTEGPPNKPLWKLSSKDMSTAGYWSQSTHNLLVEGREGGLYWNPSYSYKTKTREVTSLSPQQIKASEKWIRVKSVQPMKINTGHLYLDNAGMPIPVLNGTVPAAVTIHQGRWGSNMTESFPGTIIQREDGTYMATTEADVFGFSDTKIFLEYWLVPENSRPRSPFNAPHATGITTAESRIHQPGTRNDFGLSRADDAVNDFVEGLPQSGLDRTTFLEKWFDDNFTYELAPFEKLDNGETEDMVVKDVPDYINLVFNEREANCNVANTALVADNPKQLTAATGYSNGAVSRSGYDTLSSAEGHMWAVDKDGNTYDATPSKGMSAEDAEYFEEDFTQKDFEQPKSNADEWKKRFDEAKRVAALGSIGLAAAYAIRKRKKVAETARDAQQSYYNKRASVADKRLERIARLKPEMAAVAIDVSAHALMGRGVKPISKTTDTVSLENIRTSLRLNRIATSGKKRPHAHVSAQVKTARKNDLIDPREARAARLARKLVKLDYQSSLGAKD